MLRAVEVGISITELDLLTIGMVMDMFIEKINDTVESDDETMATQEDIDNF